MILNQTQMANIMVDTFHVYLLLAVSNGKAKKPEVYPAVDQLRNTLLTRSPADFQKFVDEFMKGNNQAFHEAVKTLNG